MLVAIHACVACWWVWPPSAKSGEAMAATLSLAEPDPRDYTMLGPLPTPLDQEVRQANSAYIECYRCSFAALCSCVSVAILS